MSEENKTVELKDEDLEKVSGGQLTGENGQYLVGTPFTVFETWPCSYHGEWFANASQPDFIYNVFSSGDANFSFVANRFWYKDGEAWPYGTCSFGLENSFYVVSAPTIIHKDFTGVKPF